MPEDVKPHQLYKQVEGTEVLATFDGIFLDDSLTATNAWETIFLGIGSGAVVNRTYIDLEGWSAQQLTTFVQGVDVQKMRTPVGNGLVMPLIWEYDILSTRKLRLAEMSFFPMVPGFLGGPSDLDLKDVVYAQSRTYAQNSTVPLTYVTTDTSTYGSGNPTAMSRLHWTRLIVFAANGNALIPPATEAALQIYPVNLVVQAASAKEEDLIWIERVRRSHIHQDRADI